MPNEQYITVTLKRDIVKALQQLAPKKHTSVVVTEAIQEYIVNKQGKAEKRTPETRYLYLGGTNSLSVDI